MLHEYASSSLEAKRDERPGPVQGEVYLVIRIRTLYELPVLTISQKLRMTFLKVNDGEEGTVQKSLDPLHLIGQLIILSGY